MMKLKILLLGLFSAWCTSMQAQTTFLDYRPLVEEGKIWKTAVGLEDNNYVNYIGEDTLINGEIWKKVYNDGWFYKSSYYAAIREVDKKVYAISRGSNKHRLLYNFNVKEGDLLKCGVQGADFLCLLDTGEKNDSLFGFEFHAYLKVEHIDTIETRGQQHRRFMFTLLDLFEEPLREIWDTESNIYKLSYNNVVWIEGVGAGAGPFLPWVPLPPQGMSQRWCVLNDFYFTWRDYYTLLSPADIETIRYAKDAGSLIFDLQGRRLTRQPAKGVYIQDGKKRVR